MPSPIDEMVDSDTRARERAAAPQTRGALEGLGFEVTERPTYTDVVHWALPLRFMVRAPRPLPSFTDVHAEITRTARESYRGEMADRLTGLLPDA